MTKQRISYKDAGVDIEASDRAKEMMKEAVISTHGPAVLSGMGSFGGMFSLAQAGFAKYKDPILVSSTDGVGTKMKIAIALNRYNTVGYDIVNHCVNDALVQGAIPLFFLDYIAAAKLDPEVIAEIVGGVAAACREAGCALIGGETAEMPTVYAEGAIDLAGTIVGVVDREDIIDGHDVRAGDILLGLPSSGLHTNGYSLARRLFKDEELNVGLAELEGRTPGEDLLAPHRSYLKEILALRQSVSVKALCHLTGGGFPGNIPRVLPENMGVEIDTRAWTIPPIFQLITLRSGATQAELFRTFNMGIGMIIVVDPKEVAQAQAVLPEAHQIGRVVPWSGEGKAAGSPIPRVQGVGL